MHVFRSAPPHGSRRSPLSALGLLGCALLTSLGLPACSTLVHQQNHSTNQTELRAAEIDAVSTDGDTPDTVISSRTDIAAEDPNPLLKGIPDADIERVQDEARRMYGEHWGNVSERSRYVRDRILPILKEMHAPQQLEVVPVAESGYNPYAFSPVGATGLWQVMPGTARVLGMNAPVGYDARRHVEISTRGGVQYLLDMHAMFGNWPVAFAAYHRGPGSMSRILQKHPWKPENGLDKLPVPPVTLTYVRGILGLSVLLQRGEWEFPEPWETQQISLEGPIDVNQLAEAAQIDRDDLYRFNPGLNHSQYLNNQIFLHVPQSMLEPLLSNAGQAAPEYVSVRIRSGDSLSLLARRHQTSVHDLKRMNPQLSTLLHPGQALLVPSGRLDSANPPLNPLLAQGRRIHYRVRSGDNLWNIAKRFGTTPSAIARANSIKHDKTLHPGDQLWLLARARTS